MNVLGMPNAGSFPDGVKVPEYICPSASNENGIGPWLFVGFLYFSAMIQK
jgi:hypothetical protein